MPSILSACIVLYHCGDELTHALRCIQNADLGVDVYLADNTPEDLTAEKMQWLFPGVTVLPQKGNVGFGRANNAVLPLLQSKYHLIMNADVTFDPSGLGFKIGKVSDAETGEELGSNSFHVARHGYRMIKVERTKPTGGGL